MAVALTGIRHGLEDGTVIKIKQGDKIPSELPKDVVDDLKEQGAIGDPPKHAAETDDENEELKARVAELEAALEDARKEKEPTPSVEPPKAGGK